MNISIRLDEPIALPIPTDDNEGSVPIRYFALRSGRWREERGCPFSTQLQRDAEIARKFIRSIEGKMPDFPPILAFPEGWPPDILEAFLISGHVYLPLF
jgi:hypothetical protein